LAQAGFVEGRNVRIEERWAKGDYQALPGLAAELVAKGESGSARGLLVTLSSTLSS
jgi:putative ABC transport system substrate-binding protein